MSNGLPRAAHGPTVTPLVIDPKYHKVLYAAQRRLYRTDDWGDLWKPLTGDLGWISAIGVSPADHTVWVGTRSGVVQVSRNGATGWIDRSRAHGMINQRVNDFAPSFARPGTVFMATGGFRSGHILKSTDFGESWSEIADALPETPVNTLALDPMDENTLYAGTDVGVYVTTDGGLGWRPFGTGLPGAAVTDLEIHTAGRLLRAGTAGRSIWEIELATPARGPVILSPAGGEIWSSGSAHSIRWNGFTAPVTVEISVDDGASWSEIATGIDGNGVEWRPVDQAAESARIRVTGSGPDEQIVSRSFAIEPLGVGSILAAVEVPIAAYALAYDGQHLWAADRDSRTILKLDPATLATVEILENQLDSGGTGITDMAWVPERGTFFVTRQGDPRPDPTRRGGWLYEMSPSGEQLGSWRLQAELASGLAWLGGPGSFRHYLLVTDQLRLQQKIYLLPVDDPSAADSAIGRPDTLWGGPLGAAAAGESGRQFWQVVSDQNNLGSFSEVTARRVDVATHAVDCTIDLLEARGSAANLDAHGIEFDPGDRNIWISSGSGSIWKIMTCEGFARLGDTTTSVRADRPSNPPARLTLDDNVPNPYTAGTRIGFSIETSTDVRLLVYDMQGRRVATLLDGFVEAGTHTVAFDAVGLPSGLYRYSIVTAGGQVVSKTMVVVK